MKWLKRYRLFESNDLDIEKIRSLIGVINNAEFTPKKDMVSLLSLYKCVVIKTKTPVQSVPQFSFGKNDDNPKNYKTNWVSIRVLTNSDKLTVTFYPDESTAVEQLSRAYRPIVMFGGGVRDFRDILVLDYNDINYLEIENILSDYDIDVDEMWCIPLYEKDKNI
jgi:hypothetical protein